MKPLADDDCKFVLEMTLGDLRHMFFMLMCTVLMICVGLGVFVYWSLQIIDSNMNMILPLLGCLGFVGFGCRLLYRVARGDSYEKLDFIGQFWVLWGNYTVLAYEHESVRDAIEFSDKVRNYFEPTEMFHPRTHRVLNNHTLHLIRDNKKAVAFRLVI